MGRDAQGLAVVAIRSDCSAGMVVRWEWCIHYGESKSQLSGSNNPYMAEPGIRQAWVELNVLLWVHDGGLFAEDNKMGLYRRT